MTKFKMNLRNVAFMTACLAVSMMLFSSCKKDSGNSGNGTDPDSNLFIGMWNQEEDDNIILNVTEKTWKIEYYGDLVYSGTYTYKGYNAELTVTKSNDEDLEVGDEGTAKVSSNGKTLTVTFYDNEVIFTKDGNTPPPGGLYREPYLNFGASKSAVKSYEDRTLDEEGDNSLVFLGENKDVNMVYYGFEYGQLDFDLVVLNCTEKKAMDFLSEQYTYLGSKDEIEYFETSDETTYVALYYHSQVGLSVEYGLWEDRSTPPMVHKTIQVDLKR